MTVEAARMKTAVLSCCLLALGAAPPTSQPANPATLAIGEIVSNKAAIRSYTFDVHVKVVMHSFPWLRFHLDGVGRYDRNGPFVVHFIHVPWFGKGFETISLAAIDPEGWPKKYDLELVERHGDRSVLALHDRVRGHIKSVRATVDARAGLREVLWQYENGGVIHLTVEPTTVQGFQFPALDSAEISVPAVKATAQGEFSNYHVIADQPTTTQAR